MFTFLVVILLMVNDSMSTNPFEAPPGSGKFKENAEMPYSPNDSDSSESEIERVLRTHEAELLAIDGVEGVGIGQDQIGEDAIIVYIRDSAVKARIPSALEGYPVLTEITGIIEPLPLK